MWPLNYVYTESYYESQFVTYFLLFGRPKHAFILVLKQCFALPTLLKIVPNN